MGIVMNTLICFSRICHKKREKPYFKGKEYGPIDNFFYKESEKHPKVFDGMLFSEGGDYHRCSEIEKEFGDLITAKLIQSLWPDDHPYWPTEGLFKNYRKVKDKKTFNKIALDFYNELGCVEKGMLRKDLLENKV